jgi:hypothetical protein
VASRVMQVIVPGTHGRVGAHAIGVLPRRTVTVIVAAS